MSNLSSVLHALGMGANSLYAHRQRKQEIAREEQDKAEERAYRDRSLRAQMEHQRALEALQQAQIAATENQTKANVQHWENADLTDRRTIVTKQAEAAGFMPASPDTDIAADDLGFPRIRPIAEVMDAARAKANEQRYNVDIPGQGTVIYDPGHMAGMNSFMSNTNRTPTAQPFSARLAKVQTEVKNAEATFKAENPFDARFGWSPEQLAALNERKRAARERVMGGLRIGWDERSQRYYDVDNPTDSAGEGLTDTSPPPGGSDPDLQSLRSSFGVQPPAGPVKSTGKYDSLFK